jgi:hypothetical protein
VDIGIAFGTRIENDELAVRWPFGTARQAGRRRGQRQRVAAIGARDPDLPHAAAVGRKRDSLLVGEYDGEPS